MAPASVTARLNYLDQAAQLLFCSSPAISAYLGSQRLDDALQSDERSTPKRTEHLCTACGNILLLGRSSRAKNSRGTRKDRIEKSNNNGVIIHICLRCGNETTQQKHTSQKSAQMNKTQKSKNLETGHPALPAATDTKPTLPTVRSTSVEIPDAQNATQAPARRRPRNKPASLQALLAASKKSSADASGNRSLDLMDFLKS